MYLSIRSLHTRVIAIHQLAETDETLWLRLLGKGGTQRRAIQEVVELSRSDPRRAQALQLLISWKVTIETSEERDEEGELAMALSQAYLQWERETEQRGREQGKQEGILETLLDTLEFHFQPVPSELVEQLSTLSADQLRSLHRHALTCEDLESFRRYLS